MPVQLPVIDFSTVKNGTIKDRREVALKIDDALRSAGAFYLRNFDIPRTRIDECFEMSARFFDLADIEKQKYNADTPSEYHGYFGTTKETIHGQLSHKESFDFGHAVKEVLDFWPSEELVPGFRQFMTAFYEDCARLISQLLDCLSLALELDSSDFLGQYHTGSQFMTSLIHYPAVAAEQLRSGAVARSPAHSDLGTLTLLFQNGVGGLQVADMSSTKETATIAVDKTATYIDVDPMGDTILVNAGYLLMRWTNGRWPNVVHRVSEPPPSESAPGHEDNGPWLVPERYSIAFFSFPDADVNVEPIRSCYDDNNPKRWGALNAGKYRRKKRLEVHS